MIPELVGKLLAGKLLGIGLDAIKTSFRQPRMIEAFEAACIEIVKEDCEVFNEYTAQALGSPVGMPDEESLWIRLEQSFADHSFPDIQHLTEMLVDSWKARKNLLLPSEASDFFSLTEDAIRPIIQRVSERFYTELSQIPEFAYPFIIQELQKLPRLVQDAVVIPFTQPQLDHADLMEATLKASASLFSWPTTLGDRQWLERRELEILLNRIDTEETSTTILLGPPGSGKSALLAILGQKLKEKGLPVLAIKADKLASTIDSLEKLSAFLTFANNC